MSEPEPTNEQKLRSEGIDPRSMTEDEVAVAYQPATDNAGQDEKRGDREFILDQENWPNWPWLPLKRPSDWGAAFMSGPELTRHLEDGIPLRIYVSPDLEMLEYLNVGTLIADGWRVD